MSNLRRFREEAPSAWAAAATLHDHVARGGAPAVMSPTVALQRGEQQYGQVTLDLAQFSGADVAYSTGYTFGSGLIGMASLGVSVARNASTKRKARRAAEPQWRPFGAGLVVITDQRIFIQSNNQWNSFFYNQLVQAQPGPAQYNVVLNFEGNDPIRLSGAWAPWATIVICAMVFEQPWPPGFDGRAVFAAS